MAVARVTKIIGASLRNLTGIHVLEQKARIEKGKITEYRATVEVTFILED